MPGGMLSDFKRLCNRAALGLYPNLPLDLIHWITGHHPVWIQDHPHGLARCFFYIWPGADPVAAR